MYTVPQHIDNNKIFIVQRSEVEGRLEPEFYRPSIASLEKTIREKSTRKLRDYAISLAAGATPKKTEGDKYYADKETGIPFLRVQNLNTGGSLSLDDCLYINKETHEGMLSRSQVSEGDLLVKITGVGMYNCRNQDHESNFGVDTQEGVIDGNVIKIAIYPKVANPQKDFSVKLSFAVRLSNGEVTKINDLVYKDDSNNPITPYTFYIIK